MISAFALAGAVLGEERYADAARLLAGAVGMSQDKVTAVPAASAGLAPEDVTAFTSLDTSRLHGLTGFVSPNARDVLLGVYARETGQGMLFQDEGESPPPAADAGTSGSRPKLRVIK